MAPSPPPRAAYNSLLSCVADEEARSREAGEDDTRAYNSLLSCVRLLQRFQQPGEPRAAYNSLLSCVFTPMTYSDLRKPIPRAYNSLLSCVEQLVAAPNQELNITYNSLLSCVEL